MNETERAIRDLHMLKSERKTGEYLKKYTSLTKEAVERYEKATNSIEIAIKVLQSELDRQENKALTLSELKEMVGEPAWVQYPKFSKCKVIDVIEDDKIWFTTGDFIYVDKLDKIKLYKHKPTEGVE